MDNQTSKQEDDLIQKQIKGRPAITNQSNLSSLPSGRKASKLTKIFNQVSKKIDVQSETNNLDNSDM